MPKRTDLKKILIIGSGPIVIGQAAEFDYAGTQACLAPVSYTHLDVYKRQAPDCTQPSATPETIAATFSGKFLPTAI